MPHDVAAGGSAFEAATEAADVADITQKIRERDEREKLIGKELREASRVLDPIIRALPDTEVHLLAPSVVDAWRILGTHDAERCLVYLSIVRQKCGPVYSLMVQQRIGPPSIGPERELRLLTAEDLAAQPAPAWLNDRRFPERGLACPYGESQGGKTFFMLDGALSVARNEPWFDRECNGGGVVYVAAEGRLRDRIEAYKRHHELSAKEFRNFRAIEDTPDLAGQTRDLKRLLDRIKQAQDEIGSVRLVVIDTVARVMPGADENSGRDMGRLIDATRSIEETCRGLVAVLHHAGKDPTKGARGHSSLRAAADVEIEITRDEPSGIRTAKWTKLRDGEDGETLSFRLEAVPLPGDRGSCVVVPSEAAPRRQDGRALTGAASTALKALREVTGEHGQALPGTSTIPAGVRAVKLDQWIKRFELRYGKDEQGSPRRQDSIERSFRRGKEQLLKDPPMIGISNPYVWLTR